MWGDLGKLIVAKGYKSCPKSNKSSNLVTLFVLANGVCVWNVIWSVCAVKIGTPFLSSISVWIAFEHC